MRLRHRASEPFDENYSRRVGRLAKLVLFFIVIISVGAVNNGAYSQSFTPVAVTSAGFNADIVAESGTSSAAATSTTIDLQKHVCYSQAFGVANSITGGGLPDNGQVVSGTHTFQMQPYSQNNALYLAADPSTAGELSGTLTLVTPATYSNISLMMFGTEVGGTMSVTLNFSDGTTLGLGNFTAPDWYSFTGGTQVLTGYGRIVAQAAGPYTADGLTGSSITSLSKMFAIDAVVPCAKQTVPLSSVTVSFVFGNSLSARFCIMAVSGTPFTPTKVTPTIVNATCGLSNGSISTTVTGGTPSFHYSWNTVPAQVATSISNLAAKDYTLTLTDANGCQTSWTETVAATPLAVVTAAASPDVICDGQSSTLTASATGPAVTGYTWSPGNGTGNSVVVAPDVTTTYTVSGTDANGCAVSSSVDVTIKPAPAAPFTAAPDTICEGSSETVQYTGTTTSTAVYNWFGFGGGTVESGSGAGPYTVTFNTPGTITLQLQVSDQGCNSAVTTQQFVVSEKPAPVFNVNNTDICAGTVVAVTYTGTTPGASSPSWSWDGGAAFGNGFGPYKVGYQSTGTINLSVTNGACTVDAPPVTVNVTPQPNATFVPDPGTGCVPLTVTFDNGTKNADTYSWDFGDGGTSTDQNPVHDYTATGTYTVTLSTSNNNKCFSSLTLTDVIHVDSRPVLEFASNPDSNVQVQLRDATYAFTNESVGAGSYSWKFGDGGTSTDSDPTHQYKTTGNYVVTLYGVNGACEDSVSHRYYEVIPDKEIRIPNAFSPNGDGINDTWEIEDLKEFPDCKVSIFNRWGEALYQSSGYYKPWDGTYNGKQVPLATYYYVITIPGRKTYSGWVVVLK